MAEQEDVRIYSPGIGNGRIISAFNPPAVSVRQEDRFARQGYLLLDRRWDHPSVAVSGNYAEGELGVVLSHLLGVVHHIAQVDDLLGLMELQSGVHSGQESVGIRKN